VGRNVAIGIQDFEKIIKAGHFYIDKTSFIKEWWENGDDVTLIARPRRFGKTLNMSMLNRFFSQEFAGKGEVFEGLSIWEDERYRLLQGTYPVINLTFANVKENTFEAVKLRINQILTSLYINFSYLKDSDVLTEKDKENFDRVSYDMNETDATSAIHNLSEYLYRYYGKKVIIILDEYDTPMQEAYVNGFWDEIVAYIRSIFNATFKTNPYLERAVMTGITRVSNESIFSDLNNLKVVTTTSEEYATSFGFTEEEVFAGIDECGFSEEKEEVKAWYDGFTFGNKTDIYNPWSIINYLDTGKISTYWANTSSNSLAGKLIREGNSSIKKEFEKLLQGESLRVSVDEQIVYNQLDNNEEAIWSLLLASGYLKIISCDELNSGTVDEKQHYELTLTNLEVKKMFYGMILNWFGPAKGDYNDFIKALFLPDLKAVNNYMKRVTLQVFSYFDTGKGKLGAEPERFYHGFVLGLLVELSKDYIVTSNRESGFDRYDVVIEPKNPEKNPAIIIEFKVHDSEDEKDLKETAKAALLQIEEKQYEQALFAKGIPADRIYKYGFAFEGKNVLVEMDK